MAFPTTFADLVEGGLAMRRRPVDFDRRR